MSYRVSEHDLSKIQLNEIDTVASVLQNIAIILSTRQHTVPLYREFGLPMLFIDKPVTLARTIMVAEITDAIRTYEPRATVVDISFKMVEKDPGKLIPTVEVEITDE
jgi:phage baseplate assembly protein W